MPRTNRTTRRHAAAGAAGALAALGLGTIAVTTSGHAHREPPSQASASKPADTTPARTADPLTGPTAPTTDRTAAAAAQAHKALTAWSSTNPGSGNAAPPSGRSSTASAVTQVLRIPALGASWAEPVYEGVGARQLAAGIGHFTGTEAPGQLGNYALAGHRSGVTAPPLRDITRLTKGDTINVTTAARVTYTYTVVRITTVAPTDVDVIAQVPGHPSAAPTRAEMTLVTCWPAYGHSKRVVVEAVLTSQAGGA